MLVENIQNLLREYKSQCLFTYVNPTDEDIKKAENELGVKVPEDYIWFLKTYGEGGIDGFEVYGFNRFKEATFVDRTLAYRKYGLPKQLVTIENCDEWMTCIDTATGKICLWSIGDRIEDIDVAFENFLSYFYDELQNVIENL